MRAYNDIITQLRTNFKDFEGLDEEHICFILTDPVIFHHFLICKNDQKMLQILIRGCFTKLGKNTKTPLPMKDAIKNGILALEKWAVSGFKTVDNNTYLLRLQTCSKCKHRIVMQNNNNLIYKFMSIGLKSTHICDKCGCIIERKAKFATENCPVADKKSISKWGNIIATR
jgi:hypothetical protein